jgi:hypothetical protein
VAESRESTVAQLPENLGKLIKEHIADDAQVIHCILLATKGFLVVIK